VRESSSGVRNENMATLRFSATLGEEPEIEVGLVSWLCAHVSRHERVQVIFSDVAVPSKPSLQWVQAL
jgi:hypothetical protein